MSDSAGRPWAAPLQGRLDQVEISSAALRGNPLGDPHVRPLWVYLPPGYDRDGDRRDPRGITGKSSGGYGAMVTPMLRPDLFGGLATHAGDALFECCYQPEFPKCARVLREHYEGSYEKFWDDFRSRPAFSREGDQELLNAWCMAACYSADADGAVRLPFETATGRLIAEVWQRWLAWDPVRMVPEHADVLRSLRAIYIDSGTRDEWFLDLGAEAFRRALAEARVTDARFELFDATHMAIEYRYPIAISYLAERLS